MSRLHRLYKRKLAQHNYGYKPTDQEGLSQEDLVMIDEAMEKGKHVKVYDPNNKANLADEESFTQAVSFDGKISEGLQEKFERLFLENLAGFKRSGQHGRSFEFDVSACLAQMGIQVDQREVDSVFDVSFLRFSNKINIEISVNQHQVTWTQMNWDDVNPERKSDYLFYQMFDRISELLRYYLDDYRQTSSFDLEASPMGHNLDDLISPGRTTINDNPADSHQSENMYEDPDLKLGEVEEPYSTSSGPMNVRFDDDKKYHITKGAMVSRRMAQIDEIDDELRQKVDFAKQNTQHQKDEARALDNRPPIPSWSTKKKRPKVENKFPDHITEVQNASRHDGMIANALNDAFANQFVIEFDAFRLKIKSNPIKQYIFNVGTPLQPFNPSNIHFNPYQVSFTALGNRINITVSQGKSQIVLHSVDNTKITNTMDVADNVFFMLWDRHLKGTVKNLLWDSIAKDYKSKRESAQNIVDEFETIAPEQYSHQTNFPTEEENSNQDNFPEMDFGVMREIEGILREAQHQYGEQPDDADNLSTEDKVMIDEAMERGKPVKVWNRDKTVYPGGEEYWSESRYTKQFLSGIAPKLRTKIDHAIDSIVSSIIDDEQDYRSISVFPDAASTDMEHVFTLEAERISNDGRNTGSLRLDAYYGEGYHQPDSLFLSKEAASEENIIKAFEELISQLLANSAEEANWLNAEDPIDEISEEFDLSEIDKEAESLIDSGGIDENRYTDATNTRQDRSIRRNPSKEKMLY